MEDNDGLTKYRIECPFDDYFSTTMSPKRDWAEEVLQKRMYRHLKSEHNHEIIYKFMTKNITVKSDGCDEDG